MQNSLFGKSSLKCFILSCGETLNCDKQFRKNLHERIPDLKVVDKVEECDVILVFCPVVSQAGTDIEAALKQLQIISDTKPAVVVVLHHTHDSECVVPDSSRSVQREKTITADFLFFEDQGLLQCTKNTESFTRITNHLKFQLPKESQTSSGLGWFDRFRKINNSPEQKNKNDKEMSGNQEKTELQKKLGLMLLVKAESQRINYIILDREMRCQQSVMTPFEWQDVKHYVSQSGASHDFRLLFVPAHEPTDGKKWMLDEIEKLFGKECWRNTVIILTGTKAGHTENQDLEERGISFLCLNVHENINSSQVSELLKKEEKTIKEILQELFSHIRTIEGNIAEHEKLKTDFVPSIEQAINEVNELSDILETDIERMTDEVTAEDFKRSLQQRVNKTVREMKQKVKILTETLKKSRIEKKWGVSEGGAGVNNYINIVSDLEKSIKDLKSKMQKYMKQNRTHVSMLEKKDRELEKKNTELEMLKERNTVLEQEKELLKKELEKVRKVEGSITKEKRPGEEGQQGEEMCQDDEKEQIINTHGQDRDAQRDDKNNQSDEEQSSEEHVKRDTLKLRDGETDGPRVDKAEKEIKIHEGEQRGKEEGCISKEKRERDELEVLRPEQIGGKEQTDREEGQGGDGRGQRKKKTSDVINE